MVGMHGVVDRMYRYDVDKEELTENRAPLRHGGPVPRRQERDAVRFGPQRPRALQHQHEAAGRNWRQLTDGACSGWPSRCGMRKSSRTSPLTVWRSKCCSSGPKPRWRTGIRSFWPHGGPQAAERKSFRGRCSSSCSSPTGYNIFAPNFRGSTGYGSEFVKMVEGDWGEGPRLDCLAGMDWLLRSGHLEPRQAVRRGRQLRRLHDAAAGGPASGLLPGARSNLRANNLFTFYRLRA